MQLSELVEYAYEQYDIDETFPWSQYPGVSVLSHPHTGSWLAILMREWNEQLGEFVEYCDIKCGVPYKQMLAQQQAPYVIFAKRVSGNDWIGVDCSQVYDAHDVFACFDEAYAKAELGNVMVINHVHPQNQPADIVVQPTQRSTRSYSAGHVQSQRIVRAQHTDARFDDPSIPEQLRQMLAMGQQARPSKSLDAQRKLFIRQARFMRDYTETTGTWSTSLFRLYPTYQSLTLNQLRGYFTWRTRYRAGQLQPASAVFISIYLNELFNGVGADSPEDAARKAYHCLAQFEQQDEFFAVNTVALHTWIVDFCVLYGVDVALIQQFIDHTIREQDTLLHTLYSPQEYQESQIIEAIFEFSTTFSKSPIFKKRHDEAVHMVAQLWTYCARQTVEAMQKQSLFSIIFGKPYRRQYFPLADAMVEPIKPETNVSYMLTPMRRLEYQKRAWYIEGYSPFSFDTKQLDTFLRVVDRILRKQWKTGGYLRERDDELWAVPLVEQGFAYVAQQQRRVQIPSIDVSAGTLGKIRTDAALTQERLLTDEERDDTDQTTALTSSGVDSLLDSSSDAVTLSFVDSVNPHDDAQQTIRSQGQQEEHNQDQEFVYRILRDLLADSSGESALADIRQAQRLPAVVADSINSLCWQEFGDTIVEYDGASLQLVDDYADDVAQWLEQQAQ
ncbi:TerB N-terminal domain-containing protein [Galliscardovia ingluviei]|nr:TerB N-terminal domain-containing protein [Galliscardovia ingluviei]